MFFHDPKMQVLASALSGPMWRPHSARGVKTLTGWGKSSRWLKRDKDKRQTRGAKRQNTKTNTKLIWRDGEDFESFWSSDFPGNSLHTSICWHHQEGLKSVIDWYYRKKEGKKDDWIRNTIMIITNSPLQSFQNQTIGMTAILTSGEAPGDHDDK